MHQDSTSSNDSHNPYAAPSTPATLPEEPTSFSSRFKRKPWWRWFAICTVSAAPSFFFGLNFSATWISIPVMLAGIFLFTAGYTVLSRQTFSQEWMRRKPVGNCIRAAFGLRIFASIVFPIGCFNDMVVGGFVSVPVSMWMAQQGDAMTGGMQPFQVFTTTILQGFALSLEIYAIALLLTAIAWPFTDHTPDNAVD